MITLIIDDITTRLQLKPTWRINSVIAPIKDVQPKLRFKDGIFCMKNKTITQLNTIDDFMSKVLSEKQK